MSHLWLAVLCLVLMAAFIIAEYREKWVAGVALKGAASLCFVILGILGSRGAADAGVFACLGGDRFHCTVRSSQRVDS